MSLTPSLRIRRRTDGDLRHLPRILESARHLEAWARGQGDLAELDRRLQHLREALFGSPYYREALVRMGCSPNDLKNPRDLPHFPLLDRPTLQARGSDLLVLPADGAEAREIALIETSGSTGEPLRIAKDGYDQVHMWAVLRFFLAWLGLTLPPRPRVVLLCSLPGAIEYSVRLPLVDGGALHRIAISRSNALARLMKAAPAVIFTDPAGLHWLCAHSPGLRLLLVLSAAQHLSPTERARAEDALAAPALNYYSMTETGPIAWECRRAPGRFHALAPDVTVESVAGELVVTRLRTSVLPLLRYRTGDAGDVGPDECPCGFRGTSILGFTGRRACFFVDPRGAPVDAWQLAWLFKHYTLDAFRLTQDGAASFHLEIRGSPTREELDDLMDRLTTSLERLGWASPRVRLDVVPAIDGRTAKPEPFRVTGLHPAVPASSG